MNSTAQVALIEFVRAFVPIEVALKIEMAKVDVTVQKDLPNALALISGNIKALLLGEPERRVRRSDTDDGWIVQFGFHLTRGLRSSLDVRCLVLQRVGT